MYEYILFELGWLCFLLYITRISVTSCTHSMQMQGVRWQTELIVWVRVLCWLKFRMDYYFIKCINVLIKKTFLLIWTNKTKQKAKVCHISMMVVDVARKHTHTFISRVTMREIEKSADLFDEIIFAVGFIFFWFLRIHFHKIVNEWALNVFQTLSLSLTLLQDIFHADR